jgi:hypothetical protein
MTRITWVLDTSGRLSAVWTNNTVVGHLGSRKIQLCKSTESTDACKGAFQWTGLTFAYGMPH